MQPDELIRQLTPLIGLQLKSKKLPYDLRTPIKSVRSLIQIERVFEFADADVICVTGWKHPTNSMPSPSFPSGITYTASEVVRVLYFPGVRNTELRLVVMYAPQNDAPFTTHSVLRGSAAEIQEALRKADVIGVAATPDVSSSPERLPELDRCYGGYRLMFCGICGSHTLGLYINSDNPDEYRALLIYCPVCQRDTRIDIDTKSILAFSSYRDLSV